MRARSVAAWVASTSASFHLGQRLLPLSHPHPHPQSPTPHRDGFGMNWTGRQLTGTRRPRRPAVVLLLLRHARIGVWSDPVGGVTGYERRARMIDPRTLRPSCCACRMDCCPRLGPVVDATKWCQRILSLSPCSFNTRVVLANRPPPLEYNNFTEIKNRI